MNCISKTNNSEFVISPPTNLKKIEGELSNLHNIELFDVTNSETLHKIGQFIVNNKKNDLQPEVLNNLESLEKKLNRQIETIKKDTTGVFAFFHYLFRPREKAEKMNQIVYMELFSNFIRTTAKEAIVQAQNTLPKEDKISEQKEEDAVNRSKLEQKQAQSAVPEEEKVPAKLVSTEEELAKPDAPKEDKLPEQKEEDPVNPSKPEQKQAQSATPEEEKVPAKLVSTEEELAKPDAPKEQKIPEEKSSAPAVLFPLADMIIGLPGFSLEKKPEEQTSLPPEPPSAPPPPSSDFAPPPPPPSGSLPLVPLITAEEKYYQAQRKKIENQLLERADAKFLYMVSPPKDEAKLRDANKQIEKDIQKWTQVERGTNQQNLKTVAETAIEEKKKYLQKNEELLKGDLLPINFNTSEFQKKMQKYTNEELKLIIGMLFEGHPPATDHLNYSNYAANKELFDGIFNEWEQLSNKENAKLFLSHQKEWAKYLSTNIFGVIDILKRRNLSSPKNVNYLAEPSYAILSYVEKKTTPQKEKIEAVKKPTKKGNEDFLEGLKKKMTEPLAKASDRVLGKQPPQKSFVRETALELIRSRPKLNKTGKI
jgi:hypothetical protein